MPRKGATDTADDRARAAKRQAAYAAAHRIVALRHPEEFTAAYRAELRRRGLVDHPAVNGAAS